MDISIAPPPPSADILVKSFFYPQVTLRGLALRAFFFYILVIISFLLLTIYAHFKNLIILGVSFQFILIVEDNDVDGVNTVRYSIPKGKIYYKT